MKNCFKNCLRTAILFTAFFACGFLLNAEVRSSSKTWQWPETTPDKVGLNSTALKELVKLIREGKKFATLDSLLIVRYGKLVVEEYFNGYNASRTHMLQSVSKSFTSALIGIAIEQGKLKNVDEKMLDFFPDYTTKNMNPLRAMVRLQDLLTMRSGTDYHERGPNSPHDQLNRLSRGWDKFYLNREMVKQPGTFFQYDSGAVILLSSILKNRTGMHADQFALKYLFEPMGIDDIRWEKNSEGHPHTGGGLYLRPRDMAKLGLLYLQGGRWQGKQVVPENWVNESVQKHVSFPEQGIKVAGYGYLWWILKPDPNGAGEEHIYAAMGFMAQYIFVIPEHQMVVAVTGNIVPREEQEQPIQFLYSHILPAVQKK